MGSFSIRLFPTATTFILRGSELICTEFPFESMRVVGETHAGVDELLEDVSRELAIDGGQVFQTFPNWIQLL